MGFAVGDRVIALVGARRHLGIVEGVSAGRPRGVRVRFFDVERGNYISLVYHASDIRLLSAAELLAELADRE